MVVEEEEWESGFKGVRYKERGEKSTGEKIHMTFVEEDKGKTLKKGETVKREERDGRGK